MTASVANIHGILRLAEKFDFMIAEDHAYSDFGSPHLSSIAQLDELRRVIYIGSYLKVLCPGMRIGFLAAPSACVPQLLDAKVLAVLYGSTLDEFVLRELLASGKYRKHLQRLRERVAKARHLAGMVIARCRLAAQRREQRQSVHLGTGARRVRQRIPFYGVAGCTIGGDASLRSGRGRSLYALATTAKLACCASR